MSVIFLFGINGSGKDRVAQELLIGGADYRVVPLSRLYMQMLGILDSYDQRNIVTDHYMKLDKVSQAEINKVTKSQFVEKLKEFKSDSRLTILLGHMVTMKNVGREKVEFLREQEMECVALMYGDGFIYLTADPEEILRRHIKDKDDGIRDRGSIKIRHIKKHSELATREWNIFTEGLDRNRYIAVNNRQLSEAASQINEFCQKIMALNN